MPRPTVEPDPGNAGGGKKNFLAAAARAAFLIEGRGMAGFAGVGGRSMDVQQGISAHQPDSRSSGSAKRFGHGREGREQTQWALQAHWTQITQTQR